MMHILSISLPRTITQEFIESTFNITFKRAIEKTFSAQLEDKWVFYTKFHVLSFINFDDLTIQKYLEQLGIIGGYANTIHEYYPIKHDRHLSQAFEIDNQLIAVQMLDPTLIAIIAHVVSQSVALEFYELQSEDLFQKINILFEKKRHSIFSKKKLSRLSQDIARFRHELLLDLYLLDKPNILWEHETAEQLYNQLESILEIKERFEVLEYKLTSLKDDVRTIIDLLDHNHSSFLEWIIIWLIAFEIGLSLLDIFK